MLDIAVCKTGKELTDALNTAAEEISGCDIRSYSSLGELTAAVQGGYRPNLILLGHLSPESTEMAALLKQIESHSELEKLDPMKITVRKRGALFDISCLDVVYLESQKHDVILHSMKASIRLAGKLDTFEEMLKPNVSFLRCHQSFIVNMDYIESSKGLAFLLKTGEAIPIRKRNAAAYKSTFLAHKMKTF